MNGALGIIPSYQFSSNAAINPGENPYINRNPSWNQQGLNGHGHAGPRATVIGNINGASGLGYVMVDPSRSYRPAPALAGVTDSFRAGGWVYENRTPLVWGGVAMAAIGVGLAFLK